MHRIPALLFGLGFLVGVVLTLTHNPLFILPLIPLWRRPGLLVGAGLLGALYASLMVVAPDVGGEGRARLHLEQISKSPWGRGWSYQGHLKHFEGEVYAKGLPIRWNTREKLEGSSDYWAEGRLLKKGRHYRFVEGRDWELVPGSHSFAERRYETKIEIGRYLNRHLSPKSAQFLSALVCGDLLDSQTLLDFSRLGLVHLMVISGFHFSLVAGLLSLLMRPYVPYKLAAILLLWILSFYFGLLGCSPAVLRAWVMASMGFLALILERQNFGLNALGVALVVVLLVDPYAIFSLGFAFSFLCTAAILAFYRPIERFLRHLIPRFPKEQVWKMSFLDQHGFVLGAFVRKGLALGLAVNLAALPLTLFYFHQFPWIGLACNLFFPLLITLVLVLLPLAVVVPWLFWIEEHLIQFSLDFTRYLPPFFDFQWVVQSFPVEVLFGILAVLLLLILNNNQRRVKRSV